MRSAEPSRRARAASGRGTCGRSPRIGRRVAAPYPPPTPRNAGTLRARAAEDGRVVPKLFGSSKERLARDRVEAGAVAARREVVGAVARDPRRPTIGYRLLRRVPISLLQGVPPHPRRDLDLIPVLVEHD